MSNVPTLFLNLLRGARAFLRWNPWKASRLVFEAFIIVYDFERIRLWRDRRFDRKYHVSTSGFLTLQQLGMTAESDLSHNYRGTPVPLFRAALKELPINWGTFSFVDYGSGMGKALLLAAAWPFREISGVEFSSELHAIAQHNIEHWSLPEQRCFNVHAILADAATQPLPEGNCLLYFFNPFREALLREVLSHIVREGSSDKREIYIVYIHSSFPYVFRDYPQLKPVKLVRVITSLYEIYKLDTGAGSDPRPELSSESDHMVRGRERV